eukprot:354186_1
MSSSMEDATKEEVLLVLPFLQLGIGEANTNEMTGGDEGGLDDVEGEAEKERMTQLVMGNINKLGELKQQKDILAEEYMLDRIKLEQQYQPRFQALHQQRAKVVTPSLASPQNLGEGKDEAAASTGSGYYPGVPRLWLRVMMNNRAVSNIIEEGDLECLEKLHNVSCVEHEDYRGFTLQFHFGPNQWFENDVLSKTYCLMNVLDCGEPVVDSIRGDVIKWKPQKNLCEKEVPQSKRRQTGRRRHGHGWSQSRRNSRNVDILSVEKMKSFFRFFDTLYNVDHEEQEDGDEDDQHSITYEQDYEVGSAFRSSLVPDALMWFLYDGEEDDSDYKEEDDGDSDVDEDGDE